MGILSAWVGRGLWTVGVVGDVGLLALDVGGLGGVDTNGGVGLLALEVVG